MVDCGTITVTPEFTASNVSISTCNVREDEIVAGNTITVDVVLQNDNPQAADVDLSFSLNGSTEATASTTVPADGSREATQTITVSSPGENIQVTSQITNASEGSSTFATAEVDGSRVGRAMGRF